MDAAGTDAAGTGAAGTGAAGTDAAGTGAAGMGAAGTDAAGTGAAGMDVALARRWFEVIAREVAGRADELTRLDSEIGDADHGVNLTRGFTAVLGALDAATPEGVGDVFTRAGKTLVSTVGGASGPLYGSAFRAIGKALPPGPTCSPADFATALRAGLDAVRRLGGAAPGDKTMVDALAPAVAAFDDTTGGLGTTAARASAAASEGMRATTAMRARKGRASYLGERSVGHQDPGATSTALVFAALAEVTAGPAHAQPPAI